MPGQLAVLGNRAVVLQHEARGTLHFDVGPDPGTELSGLLERALPAEGNLDRRLRLGGDLHPDRPMIVRIPEPVHAMFVLKVAE